MGKSKIIILFLFVAAGILLPAVWCRAFEYQFGAELFAGVFREANYTDVFNPVGVDLVGVDSAVNDDLTFAVFGVYPDVSVQLFDTVSAFALGETEWVYVKDTLYEESDFHATMANLFISYGGKGLSVDAGLQSFAIGRGVVFYSDEPGISMRYDGARRVYVKGDGYRVFDHSTMGSVSMGYRPGFLERVEVMAAWFRDGDDGVAKLFQAFYDENDLKSRGNLFWAGVEADIFVRDFYVTGLFMHQCGSVEIDAGADRLDFDVSAWLADIEINRNFFSQLTAGVFFFGASGDASPRSGTLHAFMSPMPFNPRTLVFFGGGFERYDVTDAVELGGVTWDGVIVPGIRLEYEPADQVIGELTVAVLFPQEDLLEWDNWYGWEADLRVNYRFYADHKVFAGAGIFTHGNYFEEIYGFRPNPAVRVDAGVSFMF